MSGAMQVGGASQKCFYWWQVLFCPCITIVDQKVELTQAELYSSDGCTVGCTLCLQFSS